MSLLAGQPWASHIIVLNMAFHVQDSSNYAVSCSLSDPISQYLHDTEFTKASSRKPYVMIPFFPCYWVTSNPNPFTHTLLILNSLAASCTFCLDEHPSKHTSLDQVLVQLHASYVGLSLENMKFSPSKTHHPLFLYFSSQSTTPPPSSCSSQRPECHQNSSLCPIPTSCSALGLGPHPQLHFSVGPTDTERILTVDCRAEQAP